MASGRRIPAEELAVWRMLVRAHARIVRRLETDLLAQHGLPLPSYDVLVHLVEAPDRRLRMTDLAERVLLSRSGLTRLIDRMERDGLVVREACAVDARGLYAVLTDAGYTALRAASSTHFAGIDGYVLSKLSPTQLQALQDVLGSLLED